jgi:MFS family permease
MSTSPLRTKRGFEAFASRDFRIYQLARCAAVLGQEAQSVAVAWHIYSITRRPLDLGYTGLAIFLPSLLFLIPSGHVADRFDRRRILLCTYSLQLLCSALLMGIAHLPGVGILPIYAVLFLIGTARAFGGPAGTSLIPHLVPEEHFVNAVTWGGAIFQFANVTGPALGGVLFTLPLGVLIDRLAGGHWMEGAGIVYLFNLAALVWTLILLSIMHVRPGRMEKRAASLKVVLAGFAYVRRTRMLLGSISLDLFVMLLGGAVALMPVFAHEVLHAGPRGLGLLRAAPAAGSVLMSVAMARFPMKRHAGRRLFLAVSVFGVATVAFGLSHWMWLSLLALFISGAADAISVIIRGSLVQLATPPEMRGRVSAVNSLFIGASNELGAFESGLTAQWWGAVPATILGGVGALVVAGLWSAIFPSLSHIDELNAVALRKLAGAKAEEAGG